MRTTLIVIAAFLTVLAGVSGLLVLTFDPNRYKGWIEDRVSDALGKKLRLEGPIELTLSLTPRVVVNDAVLEDEATGEAVASIGRAEVSLVLPALLRGEIHVPKVALADVSAKLPLALPPSPEDESTPEDRPTVPLHLPRVDQIDIRNVRLDYALGGGRELALVVEAASMRPDAAETAIQLRIPMKLGS